MWAWMCVFFFLALLPGLFAVAPHPLVMLSEHPGPDVIFYQEDGALGSSKGSYAEWGGSFVEGGLCVRHKSQIHISYQLENRGHQTCNW